MRILVTGANGQLGCSLMQRALETATTAGSADAAEEQCFLFTDISTGGSSSSSSSSSGSSDSSGSSSHFQVTPLDITDYAAVERFVSGNNIEIIINCAAYTNVEMAEEQREAAELLNATAPGQLAQIAAAHNALLIHISTDYVFGREPYNTPCREEHQGTPTGVYGETKLMGEKRVLESGCKYVIVRTSWLYSATGKNFVKSILNLTSTKSEIKVVFDQVGTPTYAGDLAEAILAIVKDYTEEMGRSGSKEKSYTKSGLYHFSNEGVCSWYDFAVAIAGLAGTAQRCHILPCLSSQFPSKVVRPSYSVLDKSKIKRTFGLSIPHWHQSLRKCLKELLRTSNPNL